MIKTIALVLALTMAAGACGGDDDEGDIAIDDTTPTASDAAPPTPDPTPTPEAPTAEPAGPTPTPPVEPTATPIDEDDEGTVELRLIRCADADCSTVHSSHLDESVPGDWPAPGSRLLGGWLAAEVRDDGRPLVVSSVDAIPQNPDPETDYSETVIYSCDDPACSTVATSIIDQVANKGAHQIAAALLPNGSLAIAAYRGPEGICSFGEDGSELACIDPDGDDISRLELLICSDPDRCLDTAEVVTLETQGFAGQWPAMMVDPSTGAPMVLYGRQTSTIPDTDRGLLEVRLARCGEPKCEDFTITTLTEPAEVDIINTTKPVVLPDGAPVFVFTATSGAATPSLYACSDPTCAEVVETGWPATATDLAVDRNGYPIVVDTVADLGFTVRLTRCGDRFCSSGNQSVEVVELRTGDFGGARVSFLPDGRPVFTYAAGSSPVFNPTTVLVCSDPECADSSTSPLVDLLTPGGPDSPDLPLLGTFFSDTAGMQVSQYGFAGQSAG